MMIFKKYILARDFHKRGGVASFSYSDNFDYLYYLGNREVELSYVFNVPYEFSLIGTMLSYNCDCGCGGEDFHFNKKSYYSDNLHLFEITTDNDKEIGDNEWQRDPPRKQVRMREGETYSPGFIKLELTLEPGKCSETKIWGVCYHLELLEADLSLTYELVIQ